MKALAALMLMLALAVPGSGFQLPAPLAVRFHHVHFQVGDPAAALGDAAEKLGGRREVVSGLGVGLRLGNRFLIFERPPEVPDVSPPARLSSAAAGYTAALAWLRAKGLVVEGDPLTTEMTENIASARYTHIAFATAAFDGVVARLGQPASRGAETALFDAGDVLVEIVRDTDVPETFWCPMHPDVRAGAAGKCWQCGMDLVPIPPPKVGEYRMDVALQRTARGASGVRLTIRDPETNAIVTGFETIHEKTFHLFIVSRDLEYFAHVHPQRQKDGSFLLRHPLAAGEYMLIADFLPVGGTSQLLQRAIAVGVRSQFSKNPKLENRDLTPGETVVDGVRVVMKVEDMAPGKDACLTFTLSDASTGRPIEDLQPFLGAPAHLLLVRGGLEDAVHVHPEELQTGGPTISFHPLIPAAGPYKLWIQFRRGGRESTASFRLTARQTPADSPLEAVRHANAHRPHPADVVALGHQHEPGVSDDAEPVIDGDLQPSPGKECPGGVTHAGVEGPGDVRPRDSFAEAPEEIRRHALTRRDVEARFTGDRGDRAAAKAEELVGPLIQVIALDADRHGQAWGWCKPDSCRDRVAGVHQCRAGGRVDADAPIPMVRGGDALRADRGGK